MGLKREAVFMRTAAWQKAVCLAVLVTCTAGLTGCPASRGQNGPKEEGALQNTGRFELGLQLLTEGEDKAMPSLNAAVPGGILDNLTKTQGRIQINKRIPFARLDPAEKRIFFVFPQGEGSSKITDADYAHRIQDSKNELRLELKRDLVSEDKLNHRWFLPLDQIFEQEKYNPNALDTQILTFTLRLADGRKETVEVWFALSSVLPPADQVRLSSQGRASKRIENQEGSLFQEIHRGNREGWFLGSETYTNPTRKPLALWFHLKNPDYRVETKLGMHLNWVSASYSGHGSVVPGAFFRSMAENTHQPFFEKDLHQRSQSPLKRFVLRLTDPHGESRLLDLGPEGQSWSSLVLRPQETVRAEWLGYPMESGTACPDRQAASRRIFFCWAVGHPYYEQPPGFENVRRQWSPSECQNTELLAEGYVIPAEWMPMGYRLIGVPAREVMAADEGVPLVEARANGLAESLLDESGQDAKPSTADDEDPAKLPAFSCSGAF